MERNSKSRKIIHLNDKQSYNSIIKLLPSKLKSIEIELKEYAINLVANSSCSDWNRNTQTGDIEIISDKILLNSSDKLVVSLIKASLELHRLQDEIPDDNKLR